MDDGRHRRPNLFRGSLRTSKSRHETPSNGTKKDPLEVAIKAFIDSDRAEERFQLAQVICMKHSPTLQRSLDDLRREVIKTINDTPKRPCRKHGLEGCVCMFRAQFHAVELKGIKDWQKHQVTPEVSRDPSLSGIRVPSELVKRLNRALQAQHLIVGRLTRKTRKKQ